MNLAYAKRLGFKTWKTNVRAQRIDSSALETFRMVITNFLVEDKGGRPRFFQKTFLVADNKLQIILWMPFFENQQRQRGFWWGITHIEVLHHQ